MSDEYRTELDQVMDDAAVRVRQVAGEHIQGLRSRLVDTEQELDELRSKHDALVKAHEEMTRVASRAQAERDAALVRVKGPGTAAHYLAEVEKALDKAFREVSRIRSSDWSPSGYPRQIASLAAMVVQERTKQGLLQVELDELKTGSESTGAMYLKAIDEALTEAFRSMGRPRNHPGDPFHYAANILDLGDKLDDDQDRIDLDAVREAIKKSYAHCSLTLVNAGDSSQYPQQIKNLAGRYHAVKTSRQADVQLMDALDKERREAQDEASRLRSLIKDAARKADK